MYNNVFTVRPRGIAAFSRQAGGFTTVTTGNNGHDHGHLSNPYDQVFVANDTLLVASTGDNEVQQYHPSHLHVHRRLRHNNKTIRTPLSPRLDPASPCSRPRRLDCRRQPQVLRSIRLAPSLGPPGARVQSPRPRHPRYRPLPRRELFGTVFKSRQSHTQMVQGLHTITNHGCRVHPRWHPQDGTMVTQEVASMDYQTAIANQRHEKIPSSPTYLMTMPEAGVIATCQFQPFA